MTIDPWPISDVPWPNLRKSKTPSDLVRMFDHLDHVAVFAAGPLRGIPLRIGRAVDPRETWTRLQKASPVPLYVHSLTWVPSRLAKIIVNATVDGLSPHQLAGDRMWFDSDVAAFDKLIADEARRRGVQAVDHMRFITELEALSSRQAKEKQAQLDANARRRAQKSEVVI